MSEPEEDFLDKWLAISHGHKLCDLVISLQILSNSTTDAKKCLTITHIMHGLKHLNQLGYDLLGNDIGRLIDVSPNVVDISKDK